MEARKTLIFVVEDDPTFNRLISSFLSSQNVGIIKTFLTGESCIGKVTEFPDIIILDYNLPSMNGLEMMREIKKISPKTSFIFLSGQNDISVGVDAMKEGALDYIVKDAYAKDKTLNKILEFNKERVVENERSAYKGDSSFYL